MCRDRREEELLRCLTVADEVSLRSVLAIAPSGGHGKTGFETALTPRTRRLVQLASLVALDACTTSLRWAAELAACAGAGDPEIVGVLVAVGADVGAAQLVSSAPRLALAVDYDIEVDGWDGT